MALKPKQMHFKFVKLNLSNQDKQLLNAMNEKTNASVTFNGVSVYEILRVITRDPPSSVKPLIFRTSTSRI